MNVVLYMRYSSDRQSEQSIEGQERVCMEFCKNQGYTVIGKYIDRATSAFHDSDKRAEFQRMIADSERHHWQGIVVYKLDRFARNRYDSATYKARLKKNGVRVISATENISDNPEGVLLESVLEGMAEFYSKELSQKIKRGMNETALKCNSCGGSIPLGYKIEDKKYVIDPVTSEYVKTAFEMYADGYTCAQIYHTFNEKGWRTSKGSKFNKGSFKRIFHNEKYIGIYKYKDIRIEDGIPAIIDKDLWDAVHKRLGETANAPAHNKALTDYMLAGKLFCGNCKSPMIADGGTSRTGKQYHYYNCRGHKLEHICETKPLRKEYIETIVARETMRLFSDTFIDKLADEVVEANEKEITHNTRIPALEIRLNEIDVSINNLLKLVESGAFSSSLSARLTELEKEKRAVGKDLLKEQNCITPLSKDMVVFYLEQFLKDDIDDEECKRHILDMLVQAVYVYSYPDKPTEIEICYNVTPQQKTKITVKDLKGAVNLGFEELCCTNGLKYELLYISRKRVIVFRFKIPSRV